MSRATTFGDLRRWCLDLQVSTYAKAVLHCLIQYQGSNGRWSYPSMARIARESGMSERKARDVIRDLEERGHLRVNRSRDRRANRYLVCTNPAPRAGMKALQPGTQTRVNPAQRAGLREAQPGTTRIPTRHTVPPIGKTGEEGAFQEDVSTPPAHEATA